LHDTSVVAQLVNGAGRCWTATFPAPASLNASNGFKDKGS
jgi:hypothetical protein